MTKPKDAFILRQSPSGVSQLESISLPKNVIVNGWSTAKKLIGEKDYWTFREIIRKACYPNEKTLLKAGYGASTMWRFLDGMAVGNWVVVPHWGRVFYLAEITGNAFYDDTAAAIKTDSCYRRPVRWLNDKKPINRDFAKSKLISRMKTQQTSAEAGDLIDEICDALRLAEKKGPKSSSSDRLFADELRLQMVKALLKEIHTGHMDPRKFEQFVRKVLLSNGATDAKIIPTRNDKGVDIIASFPVGRVTQVKVGVQVKHFEGVTENKWIDNLIEGMKQEGLSLGWFVTAGELAKDADDYLSKKLDGSTMEVLLVDGPQLAGMVIDNGLENMEGLG
jgi:predicted Mrr-cat superfamily restriction endonuclease